MDILFGFIGSFIAAIVFLIVYDFILKRAMYFFRFKKYTGKFIHYDLNGNEFNRSPEKIPNHVDITLSFRNPNVLVNKAQDYDINVRKFKTWEGKITIDILSNEYGIGYWRYATQPHIGIHEIFIVNKNIYYVRSKYYGSQSTDLQIWCREGHKEEIEKLKIDF